MKFVIVAFACLAMSACASTPSLFDRGQSPRTTTVAAMQEAIDVIDVVADLAVVGALPDNFSDDVEQYFPKVEEAAVAYLDATAPCIVLDGRLQSDPAVSGTCERSAFTRAFGSIPSLIFDAGISAGVDTDLGRTLVASSVVLRRSYAPSKGGAVDGYAKVEDVPYEQYAAVRADLRAAVDRLGYAIRSTKKRE